MSQLLSAECIIAGLASVFVLCMFDLKACRVTDIQSSSFNAFHGIMLLIHANILPYLCIYRLSSAASFTQIVILFAVSHVWAIPQQLP